LKSYISAFLISAVLSVMLGFALIPLLKKLKAGQSILSYVKEHQQKGGTPTMGGLFFVATAVIVTLAFCGVKDRLALAICSIGVAYAAVGFIDDFIKIRLKHNEGLKPYQKILFQLSVGIIASLFAYKNGADSINIPFAQKTLWLGKISIPFYVFVFIATTNCVNLTDGLDGLAGGVSYIYLAIMAAIILLQEEGVIFSNTSAITALCVSGSLLGFLVFNTNKASVFMGDTGSLALGGFISAVSIFSKNALYILIVGIIFVLTGISVIVQVVHFKKTGRRVFLMSPIHHHFQMKGISEAKIAFVYKFITLCAGLICLIFLL